MALEQCLRATFGFICRERENEKEEKESENEHESTRD